MTLTSMMHLLIPSNFSPGSCSVPPKRSRGKPALAKVPNGQNGDVSGESEPKKEISQMSIGAHKLFFFFFQYKLMGSAGISCSQESLHFCL